jgi:hypothetical protein
VIKLGACTRYLSALGAQRPEIMLERVNAMQKRRRNYQQEEIDVAPIYSAVGELRVSFACVSVMCTTKYWANHVDHPFGSKLSSPTSQWHKSKETKQKKSLLRPAL